MYPNVHCSTAYNSQDTWPLQALLAAFGSALAVVAAVTSVQGQASQWRCTPQ